MPEPKKPWRCPHCGAKATPASCVTCTWEMCEDCISHGNAGKVCGLCLDREKCVRCPKCREPGDPCALCDGAGEVPEDVAVDWLDSQKG